MRPKLADRIFLRLHSLSPPNPGDPLPIVLRENPSRDYFFPVTPEDTLKAMRKLPSDHTSGITHLWFRRTRKKDGQSGTHPLAEYICGSGVAVFRGLRGQKTTLTIFVPAAPYRGRNLTSIRSMFSIFNPIRICCPFIQRSGVIGLPDTVMHPSSDRPRIPDSSSPNSFVRRIVQELSPTMATLAEIGLSPADSWLQAFARSVASRTAWNAIRSL